MPAPPKRPVPPPLPPPGKPCPDCSGSGKKPLKYLGEVTDPCPSCAGSGTIEVVEEKLTPWQQEVVTLLRRIDAKQEQPMYHITLDASSAAPLPPEFLAQMKKMRGEL